MKLLCTQQYHDDAMGKDLLPFECEMCGKHFLREKYKIKYHRKRGHDVKFCSHKCQLDSFKLPPDEFYCAQCGKFNSKRHSSIIYPRRFCNQSCNMKWKNTNNKMRGGIRTKMEIWLEPKLKETFIDLDITFNNRKPLDGLELDIYIESLKLGFELNGNYHYKNIVGIEALERSQKNDVRKLEVAKDKDIKVIVINTSDRTYFNPKYCQPYLDQITQEINNRIKEFSLKERCDIKDQKTPHQKFSY